MRNPGLRRWLGEQLKKVRTGRGAAQLELTVEPIPKTSANKSLNKLLPESRWKKIREREYARYDHRCAVCGAAPGKGRLHCHEVWEYDEANHVQKLRGLTALCSRCHSVKHWGWARKAVGTVESFAAWKNEERFATYRERNREIGVALLEDHFMMLNGCDLKTMREHVARAAEEWNRRSLHEWRMDYGEYDELLSNPDYSRSARWNAFRSPEGGE